MDDFFLRPQQRTPERYGQPGGDVDYERFQAEVLIPLKRGEAFFYRPFSCKTFSLDDAVEITPKALNIVEGTYCMHPYFGEIYDLKLFLSIDPDSAWLYRFDRVHKPEYSGLCILNVS